MCCLPVPNDLTRTQSRSSGVAPHLESSERNDPYTALLLQRCCSRSGIHSPVAAVLRQIWHVLISPRFFMIIESPSISGLRSKAHFSDSKFFSQFSICPFLKYDYPVLRMISRQPERLSSWIQQYNLYMYLLTRTQSRSSRSGLAPHLESSDRNDT